MKSTFLLRFGCALLFSSALLSACEPMNVSPRGAKKDCKAKTPKDSTATGGNS